MFDLKDKRALIGGASQGIGRACAEELARCGASVTLLARNESALQEAVTSLPRDAGQKHDFLAVDFADRASLRRGVERLLQSGRTYHILVNNTGGPPSGPIVDAEEQTFVSAFANHVLCNQMLVQLLLSGMKAENYGRIINIISSSVLMPIRGLGVSNTTRGAVANWGRTMAGELAPFGITVNNVLPGYVDTARLHSLFEKKAQREESTPDVVQRTVIGTIPMGRLATPNELGTVVAFLASPAASYVTGVNLPVDGGRTAVQW